MNLYSHPRFFLWCGFVCSLASIGWAQALSADGDRVPDYWEARYNLDTTANDGLADSDGDGVPNQAEFLADTNPTNPLSFLQLDVDLNPTNDQPVLTVNCTPTRVYRVEYTGSLASNSWTQVGTNLVSSGRVSVPATNDLGSAIFRVRASPPALFVQPDSIEYGLLSESNLTVVRPLYISNEDVTQHQLSGVEFAGVASADYELAESPLPDTTLSPGETLQVDVSFVPAGLGLRMAEVMFRFDGAPSPVGTPLSGQADVSYRLNAGGDAYVDPQGHTWLPDGPFGNAGNASFTTQLVAGTDRQPLYQTDRWASTNLAAQMAYTFPVVQGEYDVRLHFAEFYPLAQSLGARVFDVYLNEQKMLHHYDIVADVGYLQAVEKRFLVQITNSPLTVRFVPVAGDPKISALEIRSAKLIPESAPPSWGYVQVGEAGGAQSIVLRNLGEDPMTISSLQFEVLQGSGRDFTVTVGGANYPGGDGPLTYPVSLVVPAGQSITIEVRFNPTRESENEVLLRFGGDFPAPVVRLTAAGENRPVGQTLHPVIHAPGVLIDYNQDSAERIPLDAAASHTHDPSISIVRYEWSVNGMLISTNAQADLLFALGVHPIVLTVFDGRQPPGQQAVTSIVQVVSSMNIPGALALYYQAAPGEAASWSTNPPVAADYAETLASLVVTGSTSIGSSPLAGNVLAELRAQVEVPSAGTYAFDAQGGGSRMLWINGLPYTAPVALPAGRLALRARFVVDAPAQQPLAVRWSTGGAPLALIPNSLLTHDERLLGPIVNHAPKQGSAAGGERILLTGLGFFPSNQVIVRWGDRLLVAGALSVTPTSIVFALPVTNGQVSVTVQTPNGTSRPFEFTYAPTGSPVFAVTRVATLAAPTQGAWGPDGRFYVSGGGGEILALTFGDQYQVVSTQLITTLTSSGRPNILGLAFNPREDADPVRIYVAHSLLEANGGTCFTGVSFYSGAVTLLTGPDFVTAQTLIDGLPVANDQQGPAGLQFDNEGNLYIAIGGNSNAGITNCAMGGLPESPLSAAILRAPVSQPGFNGNISYVIAGSSATNNNQVFGNDVTVAPGTQVSVYAPGFRNAYDLVYTTQGKLYAPDHGPGSGLGAASTSATTQGPDPQDFDTLNLVQAGQYYGHPNRSRGRFDARQNVYYDNEQPSVPGVFMQGMGPLVAHINGIDEYRAETFGGVLRGGLLLQHWNGGTLWVRLSTNGQAIEAVELLKIPEIALDIAAGPGGAILGMHFGGNQIFVAQPQEPPAGGMKAVDIFPWRAPASGTFPFVIGGRGFSTTADTSVAIGGATATVSTVSATRIRGLLPAAGGVTTNLVDVVVQSGGRTSVLTRAFRYLPPL